MPRRELSVVVGFSAGLTIAFCFSPPGTREYTPWKCPPLPRRVGTGRTHQVTRWRFLPSELVAFSFFKLPLEREGLLLPLYCFRKQPFAVYLLIFPGRKMESWNSSTSDDIASLSLSGHVFFLLLTVLSFLFCAIGCAASGTLSHPLRNTGISLFRTRCFFPCEIPVLLCCFHTSLFALMFFCNARFLHDSDKSAGSCGKRHACAYNLSAY